MKVLRISKMEREMKKSERQHDTRGGVVQTHGVIVRGKRKPSSLTAWTQQGNLNTRCKTNQGNIWVLHDNCCVNVACGLLTTSEWSSRRIPIGQEEEEGRGRVSTHSSLHMGRPIRRRAHKCFSPKKRAHFHLHYKELFFTLPPRFIHHRASLKNGHT